MEANKLKVLLFMKQNVTVKFWETLCVYISAQQVFPHHEKQLHGSHCSQCNEACR